MTDGVVDSLPSRAVTLAEVEAISEQPAIGTALPVVMTAPPEAVDDGDRVVVGLFIVFGERGVAVGFDGVGPWERFGEATGRFPEIVDALLDARQDSNLFAPWLWTADIEVEKRGPDDG
jgi:hypothetical protein